MYFDNIRQETALGDICDTLNTQLPALRGEAKKALLREAVRAFVGHGYDEMARNLVVECNMPSTLLSSSELNVASKSLRL